MIHHNLLKKTYLASLKSHVNKLDTGNLEIIASGLNSLERRVHKLDVDNLKPVVVDLKTLSDVGDKQVF